MRNADIDDCHQQAGGLMRARRSLSLIDAARPTLLGLAAVLALVSRAAAAEPGQSIFCLTDGTTLAATRFEAREGKFLIYTGDAKTPVEYPASSVRGVNIAPCSSIPVAAPASSFGVHGSNTIGERLMPMLIDAYARRRSGARPIVTMTGAEEQRLAFAAPIGGSVVIDLQAHGSGTAAKSLVEGQALIGMASRRLNADEAKLISDKFHVNPLAAGNEHVLALDGLAIIVNPSNRVQSLRLDQIALIFSGQIKNWKELGGEDRPIRVLRRDEKSGTFDTFKNLVLAPAHQSVAGGAELFESSETLSERITGDPDAIGFVGLPYVNKNAAVSIASTCGLIGRPTKFSIKSEEYPLSRRLFLYSLGEPSDKFARDLLQFSLSDDAQATIQEADFVEQAISLEDEEEQRLWADAVLESSAAKSQVRAAADFRRMIDAARRSSAVLRFDTGSAQLDNKAAQDALRLARFLFGKRFHIVGFADAAGGWRANEALARRRADEVAKALRRAGLHVPDDAIKSYSYLAPIACNDAAGGADKNRRVEIWVAK